MKNNYILFLIVLVLISSCKATKPVAENKPAVSVNPVSATQPAIDYTDQTTWLLGYFNPDQLTRYPYSTWYQKGFDDYQLKTDAINKLLEIDKEGISIKIVMGTWCPDSRREVPRFMRVMDVWQFPLTKLTFIGVDDAKSHRLENM